MAQSSHKQSNIFSPAAVAALHPEKSPAQNIFRSPKQLTSATVFPWQKCDEIYQGRWHRVAALVCTCMFPGSSKTFKSNRSKTHRIQNCIPLLTEIFRCWGGNVLKRATRLQSNTSFKKMAHQTGHIYRNFNDFFGELSWSTELQKQYQPGSWKAIYETYPHQNTIHRTSIVKAGHRLKDRLPGHQFWISSPEYWFTK